MGKYVLCPNCHHPEIDLGVKKDRVVAMCKACPWSGTLDNTHRLASYISKHHQDKKDKAKREKHKEKKEEDKENDENNDEEKRHKKEHKIKEKKNTKEKKEKKD